MIFFVSLLIIIITEEYPIEFNGVAQLIACIRYYIQLILIVLVVILVGAVYGKTTILLITDCIFVIIRILFNCNRYYGYNYKEFNVVVWQLIKANINNGSILTGIIDDSNNICIIKYGCCDCVDMYIGIAYHNLLDIMANNRRTYVYEQYIYYYKTRNNSAFGILLYQQGSDYKCSVKNPSEE